MEGNGSEALITRIKLAVQHNRIQVSRRRLYINTAAIDRRWRKQQALTEAGRQSETPWAWAMAWANALAVPEPWACADA